MRKEFVSKDDLMFTDVMAPGVKLIASHSLLIPEYLVIRNKQSITLESFESYEIITINCLYLQENSYLTDVNRCNR